MREDIRAIVYVILISCVVLTMFAMQTAMIRHKREISKQAKKMKALAQAKQTLDAGL